MDYVHILKRIALFRECDLSGYVHPSNYFRWFEEARFCIAKQVGLSDYFGYSQIYFPVIASECECYSRIEADTAIQIRTTLALPGKAKIKFTHFVYEEKTDTLFMKGTTQVAAVSRESGAFMRFSEALADHIACFTEPKEEGGV